MPIPEVDDKTCGKLFPIFLTLTEPFHFNSLHSYLNENGLTISKPSLSQHLKHLEKKELITRTKVENTQFVNYQYNWEKWGKLDEIVKTQRKIERRFREDREQFDSNTASEQVTLVHMVLILRGLIQLRLEMLKIIEPEKEFQHNLEIIMYGRIWERYKRRLLENFKNKGEEYRKQLMDEVEELIKKYMEFE